MIEISPLIHIGYHKTGTTWLQKNFLYNPAKGFLAADRKDIGKFLIFPHALDFDPSKCRQHFQPILQDAVDRGLMPVIARERLSGNPHSGGYDCKELADRLARVFPTAKILVVIREQKSIILSNYKQYVKQGGPCSLKLYLQGPPRGRTKLPLFDFEYFKYHRLIKYYINLFGQSNVLVLPYEQFKVKPQDFIREIMLFCNLKIETQIIETLPYSAKQNESLSGIMTALKRRLNPIISDRISINPSVLLPVPGITPKIRSCLQALDTVIPQSFKEIFDKRLRATIAELVGDRYKESNEMTSEMLNLNLAQYGYDVTP